MSWAYLFLPIMQLAAKLAPILACLGVMKALDLPLSYFA
jgi:hypothetical protein